MTEFTVYYLLEFDFSGHHYGIVEFGNTSMLNETSIQFELPFGFLPNISDSRAPLYTQFSEQFSPDGDTYRLHYGLYGSNDPDSIIIYNLDQLEEQFKSEIDVLFSDETNEEYYEIDVVFTTPPNEPFTLSYGLKSEYSLGAGFQKIGEPYSESTRLIYTEEEAGQSKIFTDTTNILSPYSFSESALYISLDKQDNKETTLTIFDVPLLYSPSINLTFIIDELGKTMIDQYTSLENILTIDFTYMDSNELYEFSSPSLELQLTPSQLSSYEQGNSYIITYEQDLQALYEILGMDNIDISITISQEGDVNNLPYLLMTQYGYLTDEYIIETHDSMPLDENGEPDYAAITTTPHFYQITSQDLTEAPFNLLSDSQITVALTNLSETELVSLNSDNGKIDFISHGTKKTFTLSEQQGNAVPNLALFINCYDIDMPQYQDGYLDLYYGSGTEVEGEKRSTSTISMTAIGTWLNYRAKVEDNVILGWDSTYDFTDKFLTTDRITVSGKVFYHALANLSESSDEYLNKIQMKEIFDSYTREIEFGIPLPEQYDIADIRAVGHPYEYHLSIQGFPVESTDEYMQYLEADDHDNFPEDEFNQPTNRLPDIDLETGKLNYEVAIDENDSAYLLFFVPLTTIYDLGLLDGNGDIMIDFHAHQTFRDGQDYYIKENYEIDGNNYIEWDYTLVSGHPFKFHPDFNENHYFTVEYSALEWSIMKQMYIHYKTDSFVYQPETFQNVSLFYPGDASIETFGVRNTIPEDQLLDGHILFPSVYVLTETDENSDEYEVRQLKNTAIDSKLVYKTPDPSEPWNYTIDFEQIAIALAAQYPGEHLVNPSFLSVEAHYYSDQWRYELSSTPFNYEYLEKDSNYHLKLTIKNPDGIIIDERYSNETEEIGLNYHTQGFDTYVQAISSNYIYFKEGVIDKNSTIEISYHYKLQPGLQERKHFLISTTPYTQAFNTEYLPGASNSSSAIYRERYRKLSGGSIIAPFDYMLSINETYSLYLSYRLNQRDYFQHEYTTSEGDLTGLEGYRKFGLLDRNLRDTGLVRFAKGAEKECVKVYFYNYRTDLDSTFTSKKYPYIGLSEEQQMQPVYGTTPKIAFLDPSLYEVDSQMVAVSIKQEALELIERMNPKDDKFYISFVPQPLDLELLAYKFQYLTSGDILDSLDVLHWDVPEKDDLDVYPNLDAYYYKDKELSSIERVVCHASELSIYLEDGHSLEFDVEAELQAYDPELLSKIHEGKYASIFIKTNIENLESLESLQIQLIDKDGNILNDYTQIISTEEIDLNDFELHINLPSYADNKLKIIKFIPIFRTDDIYSLENKVGISQYDLIKWDEEDVITNETYPFMFFTLETNLQINASHAGREFAYLFNNRLERIYFPEGVSIEYTKIFDDDGNLLQYALKIPKEHIDPLTGENATFSNEDLLFLKYYSPVERAISLGIGKIYFERAFENNEKSEFMMVNAENQNYFSQFAENNFGSENYWYEQELQITPFDTEHTGTFKTAKLDINLSALEDDAIDGKVPFSHILFTVPHPLYELTINEILILNPSQTHTTEHGSTSSRLWQYSEIQAFAAGSDPAYDEYKFNFTQSVPLFYNESDPAQEWLNYIRIFDEDQNYYSVGLFGDQYQLHYDQENKSFSWNPTFNQYPVYYGMQFEEELMIDPNHTLYIEYCSNESWKEPIVIEDENVDLTSIWTIYDFIHTLRPQYYNWFIDELGYEDNEYSLMDDIDYNVTQYLTEQFTVYDNITEYTHQFDIGNYSFTEDYLNLSLSHVVAITPDFEQILLSDNENYTITFNAEGKNITIESLHPYSYLNEFDTISVVLNFSRGPINSFTELYLTEDFFTSQLNYSDDLTSTFYDTINIYYETFSQGFDGEILFMESSSIITSEDTLFTPISYSSFNAITDQRWVLMNYYSGNFDNFKLYYDDSSIFYQADIDQDGKIDFKHTLDIDRDGKMDIIRYGEESNNGEIIWYTIIQAYERIDSEETHEMEDKKETKWFDINDKNFANYEFNIAELFGVCLTGGLLLPYTLASMMMPIMDYYAMKTLQEEVIRDETIESTYYSIKTDYDRDGLPDYQMDYESYKNVVQYEVTEHHKTLIAAKYQDVFMFLTVWVAKNIASLANEPVYDFVFNDFLTEYHLDHWDFRGLPPTTLAQLPFILSTYRKYYWDMTSEYTDSFTYEQIKIIEYDDQGEISESRIYKDDFRNDEIGNVAQFLSNLIEEHRVTNVETGEQLSISFNPNLPFSRPEDIDWECEVWGVDGVPIKFDSLTVLGGDGLEVIDETNVYQQEIIIRIPNRYSLYNDFRKTAIWQVANMGFADFKVEGILVTPQDGKVYITSDMICLAWGVGKVPGKYFYVDSTGNGFYDTVYIVAATPTDTSGTPTYKVLAIGYNYDGIHDFKPYEKIYPKSRIESNFWMMAIQTNRFDVHWTYQYGNLIREPLLWPTLESLIWNYFKPADHIFEIWKSTALDWNGKSLLYHYIETTKYYEAWFQYGTQYYEDFFEQTFMGTVSSALSVFTQISVQISFGILNVFGAAAIERIANAAGSAIFILTYTLMTKFFMDIDRHEVMSKQRAYTYYPSKYIFKFDPQSMNEKCLYDKLLGDSMATALLGHYGAYYTTAVGESEGFQVTAEVMVTPPNYARMMTGWQGFFEFLGMNLIAPGSHPAIYYGLTFDQMNLDWYALTSELPLYTSPFLLFLNSMLFGPYYMYRQNTLGAVETITMLRTLNHLNTIQATSIGGDPRYRLVNRYEAPYNRILPEKGLYSPVVLSPEWNQYAGNIKGMMYIWALCHDFPSTVGLGSENTLTEVEKLKYKAKFIINPNGFEYPIESIQISLMQQNKRGGIFASSENLISNIQVQEEDFEVIDGTIYFTKTLDEIVAEQYKGYEELLAGIDPEQYLLHYGINIIFSLTIPDTNNETHKLALAQATQFAVMDYFNQYVQAQTIAQIKSEIAYTETLTFWSTIMTTALSYFGGWGATGTGSAIAEVGAEVGKEGVKIIAKEVLKQVLKVVLKTIYEAMKEVLQEVILDAFIEALAEGYFVEILGMSEDAGFWISSLATSLREAGLGPFKLMRKGLTSVMSSISTNLDLHLNLDSIFFKNSKNHIKDLQNSLKNAVEADNFIDQAKLKEEIRQAETELALKQNKLNLIKNIFKGIIMLSLSFKFFGFGFIGAKSLLDIGTSISSYYDNKAEINTISHVMRSENLQFAYESSITNLKRGLSQDIYDQYANTKPHDLRQLENKIELSYAQQQSNDFKTIDSCFDPNRVEKISPPKTPDNIDLRTAKEANAMTPIEKYVDSFFFKDLLNTFPELEALRPRFESIVEWVSKIYNLDFLEKARQNQEASEKKQATESNENTIIVANFISKETTPSEYRSAAYTFRLSGAPHDLAIREIQLDPTLTIEEIKTKVREEYNLEFTEIHLLFNGKYLPNHLRFSELGINPQMDVITVMATQEAAGRNVAAKIFANKIKDLISNNEINKEVANRLVAILNNDKNNWNFEKETLDKFPKLKDLAEEIARKVADGESPQFSPEPICIGPLLSVDESTYRRWLDSSTFLSLQTFETIEYIIDTFYSGTTFGNQMNELLQDYEMRNLLMHGSRLFASSSSISSILIMELERLITYKNEKTGTDYEMIIISHLKSASEHKEFLSEYVIENLYGIEQFKRSNDGRLQRYVMAYLLGVSQASITRWMYGEFDISQSSFITFDNRIQELFGNLIENEGSLYNFYLEFKNLIGNTPQDRCSKTVRDQLLHYLKEGEKKYGPFSNFRADKATRAEISEKNIELFGYAKLFSVDALINSALKDLLQNKDFLDNEVSDALEKGFPGEGRKQLEGLKCFIEEDIERAVKTFRYLLFGLADTSLQKIMTGAEKCHLKVHCTLEKFLRMVYESMQYSSDFQVIDSGPSMILMPTTCIQTRLDKDGNVILDKNGVPMICGEKGFYLAKDLISGRAVCYKHIMRWNEQITAAFFTYYTGIELSKPQIEVYASTLNFGEIFAHISNCRYDILVSKETGIKLTAGDIAKGLSRLGIINNEPQWLINIYENEIGINIETDGEQHDNFWVWLRLQRLEGADLADQIDVILETLDPMGIKIGDKLQELTLSQIQSYINMVQEDAKRFLLEEYRRWEHYRDNDQDKQNAIEEKAHWYQMRIPIYGWFENVDNRFFLFSMQFLEILAKEAGKIEEGGSLNTELLEELGFNWDHSAHFGRYKEFFLDL
ncbi:MAG: hypothetical protein BAJALOKI1v1_10024 [Promethearchaeota archaeon]|nr:MAG: hypothetical protein BAJALOKI1v1_10024 [Candidatus Lokiarchaeota archaeon]